MRRESSGALFPTIAKSKLALSRGLLDKLVFRRPNSSRHSKASSRRGLRQNKKPAIASCIHRIRLTSRWSTVRGAVSGATPPVTLLRFKKPEPVYV